MWPLKVQQNLSVWIYLNKRDVQSTAAQSIWNLMYFWSDFCESYLLYYTCLIKLIVKDKTLMNVGCVTFMYGTQK